MACPDRSRRRFYVPVAESLTRTPRPFYVPIPWDLVQKESRKDNYTCDKCRIRSLLFEEFTSDQLRQWFIPKADSFYQYHRLKTSLNRTYGYIDIIPVEGESITCTLQYCRDTSYTRYTATFTPRELGTNYIYEFDLDAARWLGFNLTPREPRKHWFHSRV